MSENNTEKQASLTPPPVEPPKEQTDEKNSKKDETTPVVADGEKKLSNKELKELKKQEKAAKRAAKKQASGISIEQQQQQAQAKREKKKQQQQRELQKKEAKLKKANNQNTNTTQTVKKTSLFSHLETTEERRASVLAITSAVSNPKTSRITAAGLMIPMVASAISGSRIYTTSSFAKSISTPQNGSKSNNVTRTSTASSSTTQASVNVINAAAGATTTPTTDITSTKDIAKTLATISLDSDEYAVVPGISSIVPRTMEQNFESQQLISSVKELLLNKDLIHPAISLLTTNIAHYKIVGSIPRCIAMLEAFQIVINDYQTPKGTTLSRNLTNYLSHQIDILKKARPLSVTMGNAIRWLKQEISHIDPSVSDKVAKKELCEMIAQFAKEKIELADQLIIENASHHIEDATTIVVYGSSKVIADIIIHNALTLKKNIKVIVVDSRPLFEGRSMANKLRKKGINVVYALITSLDAVINMNVDYVLLGAHSILSNGFLYSRAGTAMIAMSANRRNIPVLVCCESLKFSQRVQLDSVTYNELADPNDLVSVDFKSPVERLANEGALLKQFIKERKEVKKKQEEISNKSKGKANNNGGKNGNKKNDVKDVNNNEESKNVNVLDDWQNLQSLNIVNILYDLTPPEYIKKVITEFGSLPPSSVPVILREYKGSA
ncbi:translation initiation factor eIF-2B subunit delta [Monosporozyma unispora]